MTYVPVVVPPTPPSPRTRELAGLLTQVLEEYTKAHPATTSAEIRAAVRMAQMSTKGSQAQVATMISLILGFVVLGLGAGLFYSRSGGDFEFPVAAPMIIAVLILIVAVAMVVLRSRS